MGEPVPSSPPLLAPPVVVVAPRPKSPPKYPDLCGRRRLQLELQMLNREIGFIEEELQSLEGVQPVSRCCKEVNEFVGIKPDPLMPINKRRHTSCCLWRWLRSKLCFNLSWICCLSGCGLELERPSCSCPQNCDQPAAIARKLLAFATEHAPAAPKFPVAVMEHAAAARRILAVAPEHATVAPKLIAVAVKHAAAAQRFLALAARHASAAQKLLALAAQHASAAQRSLAAVPEHAAAAQNILAVVLENAAAALKLLAVALENAAAARKLLAAAALENAAAAPKILAAAALENAAAAPKILAVVVEPAGVAQRLLAAMCLAANRNAVASTRPPAGLAVVAGGRPVSGHGGVAGGRHAPPVHAAINHVAVAGRHRAPPVHVALDHSGGRPAPVHVVPKDGAVGGTLPAGDHSATAHGAAAGNLHAGPEDGAVAPSLRASEAAAPSQDSPPALSILVAVSGPAPSAQMHASYLNAPKNPAASLDVYVKIQTINLYSFILLA
ncbi:hypothetical protein OPV22_026093 [Ensete ventricosum]|uniref:G protein gamma domain-containing protein n=1 Tax=Ensete ventricosum TaxID=4639 RepID=A0AAV8P8Q3_ENSVE|nr:hypothetical protein OPV22_026093 [Ensete ventricosum]